MKFCIVGNGAMGVAHLKALKAIPGVEVTAIQSRTAEGTEKTAKEYGVPFHTTDFNAAITRKDVYICNVVKCRPPENRTPQPDEMEICGQFLFRQLMIIKPKAIVALGSTAAKALLGTKEGVTKLRGKWQTWNNFPLMVTYHPSYLLRPYNQDAKREAWEDLKKVLHFVYD